MVPMYNFVLIVIAFLSLYHYGTYQRFQSQIDFEKIPLHNKDPMTLWELWFKEAKTLPENGLPQGMTMATVRQDHHPTARTLLMRGYDERGFQIYTDYTSPKAVELEGENSTALLFVWCFVPQSETKPSGTRQVRVEGVAEKLTRKENEKYFEKEPLSSKIRAAVQNQSQRITAKRWEEMLSMARALYQHAHEDPEFRIEMPDKWGGYVIRPQVFEFFQATSHALATRLRFRKRKYIEKLSSDLPDGVFVGAADWVYEYLEF